MNKPITLIREEFIMQLTGLINNSGLPAFIVEPILRDMHSEVKLVMQRQYEAEKQAYEQALLEQATQENTERNE